MNDWVTLSPGMELRARKSGRRYTVESVGNQFITADSPTGTISADREAVEDQIRTGIVAIERWP